MSMRRSFVSSIHVLAISALCAACGGGGDTSALSGQGGAGGGSLTSTATTGHGGGTSSAVTTSTTSTGTSAGTGGGGSAPSCDETGTLAPTSLAVKLADSMMTRFPNPVNLSGGQAFEYSAGIVLRGIEQVYRWTGDAKYLTYIEQYVDAFIDDKGNVDIPAAHSFDNIEPAVLLPFLFEKTGLAKYQLAAATIRARYGAIPKNADGGFWHKQIYPNQMWLDSIYMGEPFLARYGATFDCGAFCATTVEQQSLLIAAHVTDAATGLLYHAWDDSKAASWADPVTGRSPAIWGRGLGWYAMSLVDDILLLPPADVGRAQMLAILKSLAVGLKSTQDPKTGLWFQVVDQGAKADDWLESSGSGMFVYALKMGVLRGYLDASYLAVAEAGFTGVKTEVTTDAKGLPVVDGAVGGMGVQNDFASYVNKTATPNAPQGVCAVLLASSAMEVQCP